jgi:hypothetical protein
VVLLRCPLCCSKVPCKHGPCSTWRVAQLPTVSAAEAPDLERALIVGHKGQLGPDRVTTSLVLELIEHITSCLPRSITPIVKASFDGVDSS